MGRIVTILAALAVAGALVWAGYHRMRELAEPARGGGGESAVPVEVAEIARGSIEHRRVFTGTLEARAEFLVAPKVSGRVVRLDVDLADTVKRGQRVAKLDDGEFVQDLAQATADFQVAKANLTEANSLLEIAERELERVEKLHQRGVASESQRDTVEADALGRRARTEIAKAQLVRAEAALEGARIRLGYTEIAADWHGGDERRVVAERYVDEGETVAANAPLLRIVEMNPITAVFFVTERDYGLLGADLPVYLETDAHPGAVFEGRIARIAPVFRESTRQARVEVLVDNAGLALKPGMFVRALVVLARVADATIVPEASLVRRGGRDGVFVLAADGASVSWREIAVGIRDGARVQVTGEGLGGSVVTLGQQLLDDGSAVSVTDTGNAPGR